MIVHNFTRLLTLILTAKLIVSQTILDKLEDGVYLATKHMGKCGDKGIMICLKENAIRFIENAPGEYEIVDGVKLIRTKPIGENVNGRAGVAAASASNISALPESIGDVDGLLLDRISRFFNSYALEFSSDGGESNNVEARRKKIKKKKLLLPLLLLFKLKAAFILPMILGGMTLLAFKSLMVGKIALIISGVIALKRILDSKHTLQTYEVVGHPYHSYSSTYDEHSSHIGRSLHEDRVHRLVFGKSGE